MANKKRVKRKTKIVKVTGCSWHGNNCCRGLGSFGAALAMILSYTQNSSILWAIIHGILNWFYVIYRIIMLYV